jgi:prepilin-type N-terminal cleavage/methylation domain-containing protein
MRSARAGFSLVELLVVLGILVTLAAIGAGAFISSGRGNRLAGTEQLITSALRQARYTARATGQAVLIYIDKDLATVSGVSRYPVWQTSCETTTEPFRPGDPLNLDPTGSSPDSTYVVPIGRSGSGFGRLSTASPGKAAAYTFFDPAGTGDLRNRARQITPNASGPTTGFQVTCAANVPSLSTNQSAAAQEWYPLVCVDGLSGDAVPSSDACYVGLALRRREMPIYSGSGSDSAPTAFTGTPTPPATQPDPLPALTRPCYDLVGWICVGGVVTVISSVDDAVEPGTTTLTTNPDKAARRIGYAGGAWEEESLLLSGTTLELYRQGLQVAKKDLGSAPRIDGHGNPHRLVLGSLSIDANLAAKVTSGNPVPGIHLPTGAVLDDIAFVRLGTDQPRQLPNGVQPAQTYALIVRPDGRVSDASGSTASLGVGAPPTAGAVRLIFTGVQNERDDATVIDLSGSTGAVEASVLSLTRTTPP